MRTRLRKSAPPAEAAPALADSQLAQRFAKMVGMVPGVLTPQAVEAGYMPELGASGLPTSLEGDVPAEYRYWLAKDATTAQRVRDALVEKRLITQDSVLVVDNVHRRVMKELYLVVEDAPHGELTFAEPLPAGQYAATHLALTPEPVLVYESGQSPALETVTKHATETQPWLATYQDDAVTRAGLQAAQLKAVFKVRTRPGVLFASNVELAGESDFVEPLVEVEKAFSVRLLKKAGSAATPVEERFILGIVLEPDTTDLHEDIYTAEDVRKTAHGFMEGYRAGRYLATQHDGKDITGKLLVLESYLAPVDFDVEVAPGQVEKVKKGTWLMGQRVVDDVLWTGVQKGDFTGYSIGGSAIRTPVKAPPKG